MSLASPQTPTSSGYLAKQTLPNWMRWVIISCLPAIITHILYFGWGIIWQLLISSFSALLFEAMVLRLRKRSITKTLADSSALLTALLLALALPPLAPWWLAVLGTLFAIIVAKQLYGGLGHNLFNPAMLGYVVLLVSFPGPMGNWPAPSLAQQTRPGFLATGAIIGQLSTPQSLLSDSVTQATPLDRLTSQQHQPSPAPTSPTATIEPAWLALNLSYLLGGLLLLYLGIIQWQIPVSLLTLLLLCSTLGYWFSPLFSASPMFHLASGATLCGAFFIATDPVTAAATGRGRLLFGTLIGLLLWLIRRFGDYPDGMAFAVLLANSCVPWLDQFSQPAVYGDRSSH
ncbi:MAG: RnfABCDGE type electron transport complex subunit D [Candidatus Symbiodolus clandestinus]